MKYVVDDQTVIAADLDGTLAISKSPLQPGMAATISKWLEKHRFAVISGGKYGQFCDQVVDALPIGTNLSNLILFPTNGAACYQFKNGEWIKTYDEKLTVEQRETINGALQLAIIRSNIEFNEQFGKQTEFRGGQISFSALGQEAPIEKKKDWDPDQAKRKRIVAELKPLLHGFNISIGGTTTIDITKEGIDKAYAIEKMKEILNARSEQIIFLGDALFEGGNDFPATKTGVTCMKVSGPEETESIIRKLVS